MSVAELKLLAKSLGIKGSYSMKKNDLIFAIENLKAGEKPTAKAAEKAEDPVKKPAEPEVSGSIDMTEAKPKEAKTRRSNSWNDHLKAYREEHGVSLREAMARARETYKPAEK